ncbi:ABC transporter permease [Gemmatimonas aurantiaca]|nr:ABC transporter permease [Gemmatimonas aurantiaca]
MTLFTLISFRQFFRDITRQKLRTVLTVVGIFWGTVSVILLFAVGKGLHEMVVKQSKGLGDRISIVWPGVTSQGWKGMPPGRRIRYTEDDVLAIKEKSELISAISVEYRGGSTTMRYETNTASSSFSGVWPEYGDMRNVLPKAGGRFLNIRDLEEKRRVVFLGFEVAEKLFEKEDPVGKEVYIERSPFLVIGVMQKKEQNSSYSGRDKDKGFIPSTTYMAMKTRRYPSNFVFQSRLGVEMKDAISDVHRVLAPRHGYDPSDTKALSIWDTTEGDNFWNIFFIAFRSFLLVIGCFTLITGGIGVANIMNVVVQERTKEIGIKIALGAHKRMVMMQFFTEGLFLVAIGGALGFGFAYAVVVLVGNSGLTEYVGVPNIDTFGVVLTISVLSLTGLLAGVFPARRAANMQPVEAIKLF